MNFCVNLRKGLWTPAFAGMTVQVLFVRLSVGHLSVDRDFRFLTPLRCVGMTDFRLQGFSVRSPPMDSRLRGNDGWSARRVGCVEAPFVGVSRVCKNAAGTGLGPTAFVLSC